jgi:hypothetical protein
VTVPGVNLAGVAIAAPAAAYSMAFVGYWMEGIFGLPKVDLRTLGEIYAGENSVAGWWAGVLAHVAESLLFGLFYAGVFYRHLPGGGWLRGLLFGVILFAGGMAATIGGRAAGGLVYRRFSLSRGYVVGNLLQHLVFGVVLGALYFPH